MVGTAVSAECRLSSITELPRTVRAKMREMTRVLGLAAICVAGTRVILRYRIQAPNTENESGTAFQPRQRFNLPEVPITRPYQHRKVMDRAGGPWFAIRFRLDRNVRESTAEPVPGPIVNEHPRCSLHGTRECKMLWGQRPEARYRPFSFKIANPCGRY